MNKINVKCPHCGHLFTTENTANSICEKCGKTFLTDRGAKFYNSAIQVERKKAVEAKGEAYLKVDRLLDEINYYLDNEDYAKAEELTLEALKYTEVDFRVYMAMVYAKTENFQKLDDKSHLPYLKKAITIASDEQKESLKAEYQDYYQKQNMSTEEFEDYKTQETEHLKQSLESVLKDGIPRHYAREKAVKVFKVLTILSAVISVALLVFSLILENSILFYATSIVAVGFLVCLLSFISNRDKVNSYNVALDLYDSYSKFNLSLDANVKILKQFINYAVSYINNSSELSLSPLLSSVLELLYNEDKETTEKFILKTKNANKYLK